MVGYSDTADERLALSQHTGQTDRTRQALCRRRNETTSMPHLRDADLSPMRLEDVPEGYPRTLEEWVSVGKGGRIFLRPIAPADSTRMGHALEFGDPETIQRRFLTGAPPKGHGAIEYLVTLDYRYRLAIIAMDDDGNSIGVGRYEGSEGRESAEVAIVVDPQWRHRGVGSVLLRHLESHARSVGIERFIALYQPDNTGVAALLKSIGYQPAPMMDGRVAVTKSLD